MNQLNALENPALANQVIDQVMSEAVQETMEEELIVDLQGPEDLSFDLPAGYVTFTGDVVRQAEVRELNGRDEEALSRLKSTDKVLQEVLMRGTVRIGKEKPSDEVLDMVLAGDRDYLLLRIFAATFGPELTARPWCGSCQKTVEATVDLIKDVKVRTIESIEDRRIVVETGKGKVVADMPTGAVQRKMIAAVNKSVAELSSVLLSETISEINGMPVLSPNQVLDLSIKDRRKVSEKLLESAPGPLLQEITVKCECGSELEVPLSLAALFQFP